MPRHVILFPLLIGQFLPAQRAPGRFQGYFANLRLRRGTTCKFTLKARSHYNKIRLYPKNPTLHPPLIEDNRPDCRNRPRLHTI